MEGLQWGTLSGRLQFRGRKSATVLGAADRRPSFLDGKTAWKAIVREAAADRGPVSSWETSLAHRRRAARAA